MATITTGGTGNWSDANGAGAWTGTTKPVANDSVVVGTGHVLTLDENTANKIALISNQTTGRIVVSGSRTIYGKVSYSGSDTTNGFISVPTGAGLTITDDGTGTSVLNSGTGYAISTAGTATLTISNSGGNAVSISTGRGINSTGSGAVVLVGNILQGILGAGTGIAVSIASTSAGHQITGSIKQSSYGNALTVGGTGCTVTLLGTGSTYEYSYTTLAYNLIFVSSGTLVLSGNRANAAGNLWFMTNSGGVIDLSNCTITNAGKILIQKGASSLIVAGASIQNTTPDAQFLLFNGTGISNTAGNLIGASVPSSADTRYGVARGWADGGTGATAGCGVAGGNGMLEIPNSGTPTGTQDATSDACVANGKKYGSPQRTGSAAGGGGGTRAVIIGG